ncbi:hypothetical protein [Gymnodinialimonas sp.]
MSFDPGAVVAGAPSSSRSYVAVRSAFVPDRNAGSAGLQVSDKEKATVANFLAAKSSKKTQYFKNRELAAEHLDDAFDLDPAPTERFNVRTHAFYTSLFEETAYAEREMLLRRRMKKYPKLSLYRCSYATFEYNIDGCTLNLKRFFINHRKAFVSGHRECQEIGAVVQGKPLDNILFPSARFHPGLNLCSFYHSQISAVGMLRNTTYEVDASQGSVSIVEQS